jgi:bacterioferritin (cytochrome b1)
MNKNTTVKRRVHQVLHSSFVENPAMRSWDNDQLYYFAEAIRHARTLPMQDGIRFLEGMVDLHGAQSAGLKKVVAEMVLNDARLELLQIGRDPFTRATG